MTIDFEPKKRFSDNKLREYTLMTAGALTLSCLFCGLEQTAEFLIQKNFNVNNGTDPEGVTWYQFGGSHNSINVSWDKGTSFFGLTNQNQTYFTYVYDKSGIEAEEMQRHAIISFGMPFTNSDVTLEMGNNEHGLPVIVLNR